MSASRQFELFQSAQFKPLESLLADGGQPATIIIGCGRTKGKEAVAARDLYTSERFKLSRRVAEELGAPYLILSGLHGLVDPNETLEPYDEDLANQAPQKLNAWRERIADAAYRLGGAKRICVLASRSYVDAFLAATAHSTNFPPVVGPLVDLPELGDVEWCRQALASSIRYRDLKRFYLALAKARDEGNTFPLGSLPSFSLPNRGVYVFLDPFETNFEGRSFRIVRIGTHAVSMGSKSTLRSRLRNHLGVANGTGNHRGSIFRLHVGNALLAKNGLRASLPTWGVGQDADSAIRDLEVGHEIEVTEYLKRLEVFILPIDDEASKSSLRAIVERQLIALCSEGLQPIDQPTKSWLGRYSPMEPIVKSGLWNLRDVGVKYLPDAAGSVTDILSWSGGHA